jgi:hypothetical protein
MIDESQTTPAKKAITMAFVNLLMLTAIAGGCMSSPGPRYPPLSPPLVDEPAKAIDVACEAKDPGSYRAEQP